MILALGVSIIFALVVGILAARNRRAEGVILPLLDIFQSIPILGFFPFVILGIYGVLPNVFGANIAVIILIFTSMSWNIAFGVYEAVKAIPQDYIDLLGVSHQSAWQRIRSLYIPASLSRIAYNAQISWAVGLFFLVSSEIISSGSTRVPVGYGIGIGVQQFTNANDWADYTFLVIGLIIAVIVWRFLFLREFALWSEKYKMMEEPREIHSDPIMRFYSWVNHRSISKLFLLAHGRGVDRFTSSITRFQKGMKYAFLIFAALFLLLVVSSVASSGDLALRNLPSLSTVLSTETSALYALGVSFVRVWYVTLICVAIGVPLGIAVSLNFRLYDIATPVFEVISSIPAPILLPAIVLIPVLGKSSEAVAALVIMLSIFWYIVFNVMAGVRTIPSETKELPKVLNTGPLSAWRDVYLPSALPGLVTGMITAVGGAWNSLIIAEYFQVDPDKPPLTQVSVGIGKMITVATNHGNDLVLFFAVISMTVLIVAFNLTVWRRIYHYVTKRYAYNR
ncbi:MAG: ABC transporter permease subunit [Nitrososphaerota archaeon]|nr:ABC transporter permease subunit [Nitrososphaerota archaeon]MDG6922917.1 ABC transporter permease subunit [Nitrososphaerota archaeon]